MPKLREPSPREGPGLLLGAPAGKLCTLFLFKQLQEKSKELPSPCARSCSARGVESWPRSVAKAGQCVAESEYILCNMTQTTAKLLAEVVDLLLLVAENDMARKMRRSPNRQKTKIMSCQMAMLDLTYVCVTCACYVHYYIYL